MDILVQKFKIKHNGKIYKKDDVIKGISDVEGKKLADASNGTLKIISGTSDESKEDTQLPDVDPKKTMGNKK
ncbi:hypothetical protein [Pectinatus frisingensis]|uniref:hypothetical protein n=1 Tax=Pectinatus frisingensis TaxID=865 RepID=UPI0018C5C5A6|nr:hypothetical protein [Pectinatus frisingensis]